MLPGEKLEVCFGQEDSHGLLICTDFVQVGLWYTFVGFESTDERCFDRTEAYYKVHYVCATATFLQATFQGPENNDRGRYVHF